MNGRDDSSTAGRPAEDRPAETGPDTGPETRPEARPEDGSPDEEGVGRDRPSERSEAPETAREPVPGIEHEPEPDGENIMPAKDRPGTL